MKFLPSKWLESDEMKLPIKLIRRLWNGLSRTHGKQRCTESNPTNRLPRNLTLIFLKEIKSRASRRGGWPTFIFPNPIWATFLTANHESTRARTQQPCLDPTHTGQPPWAPQKDYRSPPLVKWASKTRNTNIKLNTLCYSIPYKYVRTYDTHM